MILELSDGREIKLPDSWTDEQAREFGKAITRGEVTAHRLAELERERDAERGMSQLVLDELKQIRRVLAADRVLVRDSQGEPFASRINLPKGNT